jgi:cytochrome c oxidase cbb3-type subunit 3
MRDLRRLSIAAALMLPLLSGCGNETKTPPRKVDPLQMGQTVFQSRCVFCHGQYGEGAPAAGAYPNANLADGVWVHGGTHEQIMATIDNGVPGTPMQPWGGTLSKEELDAVARYVASLAKPGSASAPHS